MPIADIIPQAVLDENEAAWEIITLRELYGIFFPSQTDSVSNIALVTWAVCQGQIDSRGLSSLRAHGYLPSGSKIPDLES